MAKSTANTSVLVTKGDYAMVADGTSLFSCPAGDSYAVINAQPGQLFAANSDTLVTVDNSNVSAANADRLIFGVAIDADGDGIADGYRTVAGGELYSYYIDAIEAQPPVCGLPFIKDFLFKCIDVDSSYSLKISLENNLTRGYYPLNRGEEFVLTADTSDPSCGTCSPTGDCNEVACRLVDSFYRTGLNQYPDWRQPRKNWPIEVVRLFDKDYEFCLTTNDGDCENCLSVDAINRVRIGGAGGVVTTLTNTTAPGDNTQTLIPQLKRVIAQINDLLGGYGHATMIQGTGGCCPIKLLINTCKTIEIGYNDGETTTYLTPCNELEDNTQPNPLDPIANTSDCVNCDDSPTTTTYDCGIRVIVKPDILSCDCNYPSLPPQAYFYGKMDIFPIDGWAKGSTTVVTKQEVQIPENFGYMVKFLEYAQSTHGAGKSYLPFNLNRGQLGLPQKGGRIDSQTVSDCKTDYCSYDISHRIPWSDSDGTFKAESAQSRIFVPYGDTTTKASLESFLTAWIAVLPKNPTKVATTCASDNNDIINGSIR